MKPELLHPAIVHELLSQVFSAFLYAGSALSVIVFFLQGRLKSLAILLVSALSFLAAGAGIVTGHAGGELVYEHKAANYLSPQTTGNKPRAPAKEKEED